MLTNVDRKAKNSLQIKNKKLRLYRIQYIFLTDHIRFFGSRMFYKKYEKLGRV